MARELTVDDLDDFDEFLQLYLDHIGETSTNSEGFKKRLSSHISNGSRYIIGAYGPDGKALGLLNHNPETNRISFILAKSVFEVEKELFDMMLGRFAESSPALTFESGYPNPWISSELSDYAIQYGFVKHDRLYMRLQWADFLVPPDLPTSAELLPFTDTMIEEISELVFRCVDGTVDQDLFPYVYGTYETTLRFHQRLYAGDFGTHKPSYSWVMKEKDENIGVCFMNSGSVDSGGVMHITIAPEHRQKGLGRVLLVHSIHNLFKIEPGLKSIYLAVTQSNPATILYESIGFKKVNDSSTYVMKKD